ncbi:5520_t:CDS:2, partial [Racocetra fulgida]
CLGTIDEVKEKVSYIQPEMEQTDLVLTDFNHNEGFHKLFTYYNIGKERIYDIYKQEVEKTVQRNTKEIQQEKHKLQEKQLEKERLNEEEINISQICDKKFKKQKLSKNLNANDKEFDP